MNGGAHRIKKHLSGATQCLLLGTRLTTVLGAAMCSFQSLEKAYVLPLSSDTECVALLGIDEDDKSQEEDKKLILLL